MGTLYLVATPIGNLEDITFRAVRVLNEASLIAAEDTRLARRLLNHYEITTSVTSFHDDSPPTKIDEVLRALDQGDVALVSDAGMPGISDPGNNLVRAARLAGHAVIPVPGASAVTAAAAVSGTIEGGFIFGGFLPRKAGERASRLQELAHLNLPIILFESPNRMEKLLTTIDSVLPDSTVLTGREITKIHEEWREGRPLELIDGLNPRGEFTVVITPHVPNIEPSVEQLDSLLTAALGIGVSVRDAATLGVQVFGVSRNRAYERALELRNERND